MIIVERLIISEAEYLECGLAEDLNAIETEGGCIIAVIPIEHNKRAFRVVYRENGDKAPRSGAI